MEIDLVNIPLTKQNKKDIDKQNLIKRLYYSKISHEEISEDHNKIEKNTSINSISSNNKENLIKNNYFENLIKRILNLFTIENLNRILKVIFKEFSFFSLIITSVVFYLFSLEGCSGVFDYCLNKIDKKFINKIILSLFFSSFLLTGNILFIIRKTSKLKFFKLIVLFFVYFYLFVCYDTGTSLEYHGGYNRFAFLIVSFLITIIISIIYLLYKIYTKYGRIILFFIIVSFLISFYSIFYNFNKSCEYWDKGLGKSRIRNEKGCKIEKPLLCYEIIFDNLFDFSNYLKLDCKVIKNDDFNLLKKYMKNQNISKIGYPRVEYWDFHNKSLYLKYRDSVLNNLVDFDDKNILDIDKNKVEVIIEEKINSNLNDKDPNYKEANVKIELKKDNELIKERERVFQQTFQRGDYLSKNILFIFIDSMSRNHFRRKFPKVIKWLEKFYIDEDFYSDENGVNNDDYKNKHNFIQNQVKEENNLKNENSENLNEKKSELSHESFQFLKYHGLGTWTNVNLFPFFFGVPYDSYNGKYSLSFLKKKGYITGSTENMCSREFVNIYSGSMSKLTWDNYDHDFTAFFCDPNFTQDMINESIVNGHYSIGKKCLYRKQTYEYSIEYAKQFFEIYKQNAKFFRLGNIDSHEGTGETVKYDEEYLVDFLNFLEEKKHMEDTFIVIFSDHGYTMPGFQTIFQTEDHMKEILLPFLYFLVPKNIKNFNKVRENLKANENEFITPYDINNTLLKMINTNEMYLNKHGIDILNNKLNGEGNCKKFDIKEEWCKCR